VEVVPGAVMDPSGAHDMYIRLPFTFPVQMLTELIDASTRRGRNCNATARNQVASQVWCT
jgi:hypothetical protein